MIRGNLLCNHDFDIFSATMLWSAFCHLVWITSSGITLWLFILLKDFDILCSTRCLDLSSATPLRYFFSQAYNNSFIPIFCYLFCYNNVVIRYPWYHALVIAFLQLEEVPMKKKCHRKKQISLKKQNNNFFLQIPVKKIKKNISIINRHYLLYLLL